MVNELVNHHAGTQAHTCVAGERWGNREQGAPGGNLGTPGAPSSQAPHSITVAASSWTPRILKGCGPLGHCLITGLITSSSSTAEDKRHSPVI